MDRRRFLAATASLAGAGGLAPALAQQGNTLNFVVPFSAGGISDLFARVMSPEMGKALNKTVVIDNVTGASGSIAARKVLGRGAAGDTVFMGSPTDLITAPATIKAANYKSTDFTLVSLITRTPLAVFVRADLPVKTVDELITLARSQPGKPLSYGSVGVGSIFHLAGELFAQAGGMKLTHVPYRGGAPLLQDLASSQIDMVLFSASGDMAKNVAGGRMRALAVAGTKQAPAFAGLSTFADSRLLPNWSTIDVWAGVLAPAATPSAVLSALHAACASALADPPTHKAIVDASGGPLSPPMTLAQLEEFYSKEIARYTTAIKQVNLSPI